MANKKQDQASRLRELLAQYKEATSNKQRVRVRYIESLVLKENMGLIKKLVNKSIRTLSSHFHGDEEDLIQAGCLGALRGFKDWIPEKGAYSTYAAWWIRKEVQECIEEYQPIYRNRRVGKPWPVYKKELEIRARFGREATAKELGVTEEQLQVWRQMPTVVAHLEDRTSRKDCSDDEATTKVLETVEDRRPNSHQALENAEVSRSIQEALKDCTTEQQYALVRWMDGSSFRDIAIELNVLEEEARTLKDTAIDRLRWRVQT